MTTSISGSTLRISGLATGMDTDSIVETMMKAQKIKQDKLKQKEQILTWQQENYRTINSSLRTFRDNVSDMKLEKSFLTNKASSSNESAVKVTASSSAVTGIYTLDSVTQLASAASITSDALTSASSSTTMADLGLTEGTTITIANGDSSATLNIDTTDTISSLVKKVNNLKDGDGNSLGIKVSFDDDLQRFFMTTTSTGADQEITLTDDSNSFLAGTLGFSTLNATGKNAMVSLNGTGLEFDSNQFTVSGVNYNLVGTTSNSTTVTVSKDTEAIYSAIEDFVNSYNDTISTINDMLDEDRYSSYDPLTDEQKESLTEKQQEQWEEKAKSGLLKNDAMLQGVLTKMRSTLNSKVEGLDSSIYSTLSSIGITTGDYTENGKLYIDEDTLMNALNDDPDAVMDLFTNASDTDSEKGLAVKLYDNLNSAIKSISNKAGSSDSLVDDSVIGNQLDDLDEQISDWDTKLAEIEERYYSKFDAMEELISKLNTQSSYISQLFGTSTS